MTQDTAPETDPFDRPDRHPGVAGVLRYFRRRHLPEHLQRVSEPFGDLALRMVDELPDSAELTTTLRKLLEAKDAGVRCAVDLAEGR